MQNPEVWSFSEPTPTFSTQKFDNSFFPESRVKQFYFTHLVSVVIPDCFRVPETLIKPLIDDYEYYKVVDLNLSEVVNPAFLNCFLKKGELSLLSTGKRIDCDDCCAVTPDGRLILSLTKDTYQTFGLEGKLSHFSRRNKDRYIISIQLKEAKLAKGQPNYERIRKALDSLPLFTVIFSWKPPNETICPSSAAKYFDELNYTVKLCEPSFKSHVVYSEKTPLVLSEPKTEDSDLVEFAEWLGLISLEGEFGDADNYVNSIEPPDSGVEIGQTRVLVWRGFYRSDQILNLLQLIKKYNKDGDKLWVAAYTQGFSDSPITEGKEEQNYFTNGDNGNIYIFKNEKSLFCTLRCSVKQYK